MQNYIKANIKNFTGNVGSLKNINAANNKLLLASVKVLTANKIPFAVYNNSSILAMVYVGNKCLHTINGLFAVTCNTGNVVNLNLSNKQKFTGSFGQTCNKITQGIKAVNAVQFASFIKANVKNIKAAVNSKATKQVSKSAQANKAIAMQTAVGKAKASGANAKALKQIVAKYV